MPRATTPRKTAEKSPAVKPDAAVKPAVEQADTTDRQDPAAALTAAYTQAIEARDQATGVIPAVQLDATRVAYGQVPKRKRGNLVTRLTGEAGKNLTTSDGQIDTGLAVAVTTLSALFTQLDEQERPVPPAHDPVPGVAGILAGLDRARGEALASLSDEQRERVAQVDTENDPAAQASAESTLTTVRKLVERAVNGRSRANGGTRASARVVGERLQAAVAKAKGPLTLSALAEETQVSPATLWSRWQADNTPGVAAIEDGGRKAFKAA